MSAKTNAVRLVQQAGFPCEEAFYEYDENGVNLFAFSSTGSGYGQLSLPCSLEVDSQGRIYVLNKNSGTITVFQTTEFADLIHEANKHLVNISLSHLRIFYINYSIKYCMTNL